MANWTLHSGLHEVIGDGVEQFSGGSVVGWCAQGCVCGWVDVLWSDLDAEARDLRMCWAMKVDRLSATIL